MICDPRHWIRTLLPRPTVVVPLYIRFINPARRFGVFTGTLMEVQSAIQEGLNIPTAQCIGTYGGRICDKREAIHKHAVYRVPYGSIDPLKPDGPYVSHFATTFDSIFILQCTQSAYRRLRHARRRWSVHKQQLLSEQYA